MNDKPNALQRIRNEIKKAVSQGIQPTKIHIPRDFEFDLCLLGAGEIGSELLSQITVEGPRNAIIKRGNTLFGMEVVWDAKELKAE